MRSHKQIVADAGGPMKLARRLGIEDQIWTVRSWAARDSISPPFWWDLDRLGFATLEELAYAVARPESPPPYRWEMAHELARVHLRTDRADYPMN